MTNPPTPPPGRRHPLEDEPARLKDIVVVMWGQIHKVLRRPAPPRHRSRGSDLAAVIGEPVRTELLLGATGISTEDILAIAFADLLQTPATAVTTSWEALAVTIARNKTIGALRDGQAWLYATTTRPKLTVVSGDTPGSADQASEPTASLFEILADPGLDLEEEFITTRQQMELNSLAREVLDDRDRTIYLGCHFQTRTRQSLADEFNLTAPGVTHVYLKVARQLHKHPRFQRYSEGGGL